MVALEVRQKWLDLQTAKPRVETTRQAISSPTRICAIARDRYQHQVGTNTEVLDAESLRLQAYTNFYNSSYEALLTELRLRRAMESQQVPRLADAVSRTQAACYSSSPLWAGEPRASRAPSGSA